MRGSGAVVGGEPGIVVDAEPRLQEMAEGDGILRIHRGLIDVAGAAEVEHAPAARQIVGNQAREAGRVGREAEARALVGFSSSTGRRHAARVQADGVEGWVVIPKPKFSNSRVCLRSIPIFRLWRPAVSEIRSSRPSSASWRL